MKNDVLKILDFGLLSSTELTTFRESTSVVHHAPEIWNGKRCSFKINIW